MKSYEHQTGKCLSLHLNELQTMNFIMLSHKLRDMNVHQFQIENWQFSMIQKYILLNAILYVSIPKTNLEKCFVTHKSPEM